MFAKKQFFNLFDMNK